MTIFHTKQNFYDIEGLKGFIDISNDTLNYNGRTEKLQHEEKLIS